MENQEVTVKTTTELPKQSKTKKFVMGCSLSLIGIIIMIVIIVSISTSNEEKSSTSSTEESSNDSKKEWVVVQKFQGNGMKKSQTFKLSGNETRIIYAYESESQEYGQFYLYLLEEGINAEVDGAIPEVMSTDTKISDVTYIHKGKGSYYLSIIASGGWSVYVYEEK